MKSYLRAYFTHPDIAGTAAILAVCLIFAVPHALSLSFWLAAAAGVAAYAVSEYGVHRFLFHSKPPKNPFLLKLLRRLHYDHHADPNDLNLLFLPVWYSLPLVGASSWIVYSLFDAVFIAAAFASGILAYLLYYEWVHYAAHRPIQPLTAWGRYMKKLHLLHHYKNESYWYGVTTPILDAALGTYKQGDEVDKSETARNLEQQA